MDFNVTDHVNVTICGTDKLNAVVTANAAAIAGDVLADSVTVAEPNGVVKEWDINGEKATIGVEVVA